MSSSVSDHLVLLHRRVSSIALATLLAVAGCSAPEPSDGSGDDQHRRREELREKLRSQLGELYDESIPEGTIAQIQRGSKLYDTICRACHGPTGRGNGRSARMLPVQPPDLADPRTAAFFSDRANLTIIAEGIEGTPMIGWSGMLREEEQIEVLQFMKTLVREREEP